MALASLKALIREMAYDFIKDERAHDVLRRYAKQFGYTYRHPTPTFTGGLIDRHRWVITDNEDGTFYVWNDSDERPNVTLDDLEEFMKINYDIAEVPRIKAMNKDLPPLSAEENEEEFLARDAVKPRMSQEEWDDLMGDDVAVSIEDVTKGKMPTTPITTTLKTPTKKTRSIN